MNMKANVGRRCRVASLKGFLNPAANGAIYFLSVLSFIFSSAPWRLVIHHTEPTLHPNTPLPVTSLRRAGRSVPIKTTAWIQATGGPLRSTARPRGTQKLMNVLHVFPPAGLCFVCLHATSRRFMCNGANQTLLRPLPSSNVPGDIKAIILSRQPSYGGL